MKPISIPSVASTTVVVYFLLTLVTLSETLLPDPNYDELMSTQQQTNLGGDVEGATAEARALGCHLKETFRGAWFQSGIHHSITITRDAISTKGHCVEKEGEKYLLYNRHSDCYRCLVFSEKHLNVLQYKETFCTPEKRSLRETCSTITGDANLYIMFRLEAVPIECPIKGQFTMSYNRGHGECRHPPSSVESCTKSSKLVFNYQACPDVPRTESSVEELQCLASWKEGSSRYFLGLISYGHHYAHQHASYEDRFRCFVYERSKHGRGDLFLSPSSSSFASSSSPSSHHHLHHHHHLHPQRGNSHSSSSSFLQPQPVLAASSSSGSNNGHHNLSSSSSPEVELIYRVAQSGDATCNGISPSEGSRIMILNRLPAVKACGFPSWVLGPSHWHTLDQGSTYSFNSQGNFHISNFSELAGTGPNSPVMNALCYQVLDEKMFLSSTANKKELPNYNPTNVLVLHATTDCKTGYVCTVFHRRDENIMEIQFGSISRRAEDACQPSHFNPGVESYVTLVSSTPQTVPCPNVGYYKISNLSWNNGRTKGDREFCKRSKSSASISSSSSSSGEYFSQDSTSSSSSNEEKEEKERPDSDLNYASISCSSPEGVQIRAKSGCDSSLSTLADYNCHGWWSDAGGSGITYVVTTRSSSHQSYRPQRHCFAFRDLTWSPEKQQSLASSYSHGEFGQLDSETEEDLNEYPGSNSNNNRRRRGGHHHSPKFFAFSSFGDSCRRHVSLGVEGDFAFNLTTIGQCSDISSATGQGLHSSILVYIFFSAVVRLFT